MSHIFFGVKMARVGNPLKDKSLLNVVKGLPWREIKTLIDLLLEKGLAEDDVIAKVADFLDDLIDFRKVVGGVRGEALEAVDGEIIENLIRISVKVRVLFKK